MEHTKASRIKKAILSISIAIILILFVAYGIQTFYDPPKYEDYCKADYRPKHITAIDYDNSGCETVQRQNMAIEQDCYSKRGSVKYEDNDIGCPIAKGCDFCNLDFEKENEIYNRNVFFITLVIGLIALIIGGVILKLESVSTGIMGGAVLTIIYGTIRYWGELSDVWRFIILGFTLAILIWMGYKKLEK